MGRLQLALNVNDLDAAVDFYTRLFGTAPAKRRPGYANFAVWDPPLKLVLIENKGLGGTLNHLGVEMRSAEAVTAEESRLTKEGLLSARDDGACCYADQAKIWVHDPDDAPWEIYTVLADAPVGPHAIPGRAVGPSAGAVCCAPAPGTPPVARAATAPSPLLGSLPVVEAAPSGCSAPAATVGTDGARDGAGGGSCSTPR